MLSDTILMKHCSLLTRPILGTHITMLKSLLQNIMLKSKTNRGCFIHHLFFIRYSFPLRAQNFEERRREVHRTQKAEKRAASVLSNALLEILESSLQYPVAVQRWLLFCQLVMMPANNHTSVPSSIPRKSTGTQRTGQCETYAYAHQIQMDTDTFQHRVYNTIPTRALTETFLQISVIKIMQQYLLQRKVPKTDLLGKCLKTCINVK